MSSGNLCDTIPEISIHELAFEKLKKHGDNIALIDGSTEVSYTFAEVQSNIRKVASGLARLGVQKGDIVAVYSTNSAEYIFLFYACGVNGAVMAQVHPRQNKVLVPTLEALEASWLYTIPSLAEKAVSAAKQIRNIKEVICLGDVAGTVPFSQLISDNGDAYPNTSINVRDDLVYLAFSSGTTGWHKCMMFTHYSVVANFQVASHPNLAREDPLVTVAVMPFYHAFGVIWYMMRTLLEGQRQIILPDLQRESLPETIERYKVTELTLPPPAVDFMARIPLDSKYDLSSLQHVIALGAPLSKESEAAFTRRFGGCRMEQLYGMSEGGAFTYQHVDKPHKAGSVGLQASLVEIQVVEPHTKNVLGPNEMGEIWARTPAAMKGYWKNPEATKKLIDEDKWIHTGDMGYCDDDLHFYVVDRYGDLIKFQEFRVSPVEIEFLLLNHPAVSDVGVLGVPDPKAGEVPKAFVVKNTDAELTEQEVMKYVEENAEDHKHLRGGVQFVSTIPKLIAGKILRSELREMNQTEKA